MTASAVESPVRGLHIGGEWTAAEGGNTFEDSDPFTGDVVANVPAGTREDARRAIEAAAEAFPAWSETPPAARQQIFLKAADILEARGEEVVSWLTRETGATFGMAMFQLHFVPGLFRQAAALPYQSTGEIIRKRHHQHHVAAALLLKCFSRRQALCKSIGRKGL